MNSKSTNLSAILDRAAGRHPSRKALFCGERVFTFEQFARRADALASVLADEGAGQGVAVAMLHRNCHVVLEAYFAAARLGALFVPINIRLSDGETASILADSAARIFIVEPLFESRARLAVLALPEAARPRLILSRSPSARTTTPSARTTTPSARTTVASIQTPPFARDTLDNLIEAALGAPPPPVKGGLGDPAQLYYTSGTTGMPKGVVLTHGNVIAHAEAAATALELTERDVWLHAAPLFHLADAWATWAVTLRGGRHVLLGEFKAAEVFDTIEKQGVTITNLIPAMLGTLVNHPDASSRKLRSMRRILSGGAPMAIELLKRIEKLFPCEYVQTYGLTETSPYLTLSLLDDDLRTIPEDEQQRYRAMTGRPMKGVEVRVVDGAGRDVPRDGQTVGEIVARGSTVTPGYFNGPEETDAAFRDGWFHTGDLAHVEKRGFLTIVDRIKDVINSGGEQVYSTEVENALYAHHAVAEAAVFAIPDDRWGEAVRAAVALKGTIALKGERCPGGEELIAFCRERIASFKVPAAVDIVDALPRTGSGKIDKKALREPWWRGEEKEVH